jgi:hypothetical protein
METLFSKYWLLIGAIWYVGNGILHDIFVLLNHKRSYDRDLLRLLMDGHLLILSGLLMFVSYLMAQKGIVYGGWIGAITAVSMLVYCAMIFPFVKSIVTTIISLAVLAVSIRLCMA